MSESAASAPTATLQAVARRVQETYAARRPPFADVTMPERAVFETVQQQQSDGATRD